MRIVCDNDGIWFDYPLTWFITQAAYHKYETLGIRTKIRWKMNRENTSMEYKFTSGSLHCCWEPRARDRRATEER